MFRIFALVVLLVACGGDDPVSAPDSALVGSWTMESTDFFDVILTGLERYLKDEFPDADRDAIEDYTDEARQEFDDPLEDFDVPFATVRFNADGTYEDDRGDFGSWDVDGNVLLIDSEVMCRYFADGDDLTLIFRIDDAPEDFPADMVEILGRDTVFRFFLKRK